MNTKNITKMIVAIAVTLTIAVACLSLVATAERIPDCDPGQFPGQDSDGDEISDDDEDMYGPSHDPCDPCKPDPNCAACRNQRHAKITVVVSTDKGTYMPGETVTINGLVSDAEGNAVEGATVSIQVTNPSGKMYSAKKTTDKIGYYEVSNTFSEEAALGEWKITVATSKEGYQKASGTIYITVGGEIDIERERLKKDYPGLKKGYLLFSEGKVSKWNGDDYGHVGIYIGDFVADKKYKVRDDAAAPLKVFREGKPTWLYLEDYIKEGDLIIGAVVEMRWEGAVFTTVDGMKREAEETMRRTPNFAWKTTNPPPTPEQVKKIREFVLSKVALTEKGKLQYDFGEKGSKDLWTGEEEWDCCGLGEAAYEHAGLNPTPNAYEGMCDYLLAQEIFDNIDKPTPKEIRAIAMKVKSPVNLHLFDGEGRHVGVNPQGVVEKEIPNAYYYPKFEEYPQGILITDVKDEYGLVVEALDEGSFNLYLVDRNVCVPSSLTKVEFQEVLITKDTMAALKLGSTGNKYLMGIDEDGEGKVDQTLKPTSFKTSALTAETMPTPEISKEGYDKRRPTPTPIAKPTSSVPRPILTPRPTPTPTYNIRDYIIPILFIVLAIIVITANFVSKRR